MGVLVGGLVGGLVGILLVRGRTSGRVLDFNRWTKCVLMVPV